MNCSIVLSKDATGIGRDISIGTDGKVRTHEGTTGNNFVIGSSEFHQYDLLEISTSVGVDLQAPFSGALANSYKSVYGEEVNWMRALGKKKFVSEISNYLKRTVDEITSNDPRGYCGYLAENRYILGKFEQIKIDTISYNRELKKRDSSNLRSLQHSVDGFCETVRYSHKSQTGRMTVKSGPKVLLLQKEDRSLFIPRDTQNILAQVDFISLEPRVAYLLTHEESPKDIYKEMGDFVGSEVSRAKLKIATLSALYGSSKVEKSILQGVSSFFGIDKIKKQYLQDEEVYNLYGRPLHPEHEHHRLPHFIQSTAVDVALSSFSKFIGLYEITPYFMIHDSLVFECRKDVYDEMSKSEIKLDVHGLGEFYLSVSKFVDDRDT